MKAVPMKSRVGKRPAAMIVALVLMAQLFALSEGAGAQVCRLEPQLQEVLVTQGTGASPLVWGKDTLVRPKLTLPSCASGGALKFSNASLKVKVPGLVDSVVSPISVPLVGAEPNIQECCEAAVDSAADPTFIVEGSKLSSPAPSGFVATFEVSVVYKTATSTGTTNFLTIGTPPTAIAATFGKRPNPLRILIVPMGDKSKTGQYTSTTAANVQTSVEAVSRVFPVADVVGTSTSSTGGVRWQPSTGMLDLGLGTTASPGLKVLDSRGMFCGSDANFPKIKSGLANFLQAFNSANTASPADMVVGAVDGAISVGSATNGACYDGMAAFNSRESWFRVVPDGTTPSMSGAVLGMELGHNLGLVNDPMRADGERHSINAVAETQNKAYNLTTRKYLSTDKTLMNIIGTWHRENTLFERGDWEFARCRLGGSADATPACSNPGGVGSTAASARRIFRISGSTNGQKSGTSLLSNFTQGGAPTDPDPGSEYRLIFRDGVSVLQTFRLPVTDEFSHGHEDGHGAAGGHDQEGVVDAGVLQDPAATAATHAQVWKGEPAANVACDAAPACLYEAELTIAPELDEVQINPTEWIFDEPRNFTASSDTNEIQPSLSFDGQLLAYIEEGTAGSDCGIVVLERVDKSADKAVLGAPGDCRSEPVVGPDKETLVFARDGELWRIGFDPDTLEFLEDTEKKIYACVQEAGVCVTDDADQDTPLTGPASGAAFSPTPADREGQWLTFTVEGDIFRLFPYREDDVVIPDPLNPTGPPLLGITRTERITGTPQTDSEPAVAPDGERVVFTRRAEGQPPTLHTVGLPDNPLALPVAQALTENARHPSWGGNLVAFESTSPEGNIGIVNPDDPSPELITSTGADTRPSVLPEFGETMAIERNEDGQDDIFLGVTGKRVDIVIKGRDVDNAADTAGYIYANCGGADVPIAYDPTPHHPDPANPQIITFSSDNHDPEFDCGPGPANQGKAGGLISDDWSLSNKAYSAGTIRNDTGKPIGAIHYPAGGSALRIDSPIALDGSAWDAEGMVLAGSALKWELQLPGSTTWKSVGTGNHVDATPQLAGLGNVLWPLGKYSARLTATEGGVSTSTIADFEVSKGAADFDPNTLYVPSSGNDVVAYLSLHAESLKRVSTNEVQIVELGGAKLGESGNPAPIPATRWSVSGSIGTAKFNRQVLSDALLQLGLLGTHVEFVLRIQDSAFTFHGVDIVRVEPI